MKVWNPVTDVYDEWLPGKTADEITGLVFWIDAQQLGGFSDTDPVTTFTELISGNSPTQSNASFKPTYSLSAFDGLPSVKFDGSNDEMYSPSVGMTVTDNFCMGLVAQNNDSSGNRQLAFSNGVMGTGNGYGISLRTDGTSTPGFLRGGIAWHPVTDIAYSSTKRQIIIMRRTAGVWDYRVNGCNSGTMPPCTSPQPGAPTTPASYVSLGNIALSGYDWNGYFGEGFMYSVAVSDDDVANLERGLAAKWNVKIMQAL